MSGFMNKKNSQFIAKTPRSSNFEKNVQDDIAKNVRDNYTKDEIELKIKSFKTSKQIKVLDDGRLRIGLFIGPVKVANGVDPKLNF